MNSTPPGSGPTLVNVGCGSKFHPAWDNLDFAPADASVQQHDIRQGLPYAENSVDVVYHSHVLEHVSQEQAVFLLEECYRVLKPGGILRVVVPDLEQSCRLYLQALDEVQQENAPPQAAEHYQWALLNLLDQMTRTRSGGAMLGFLRRRDLQDWEYIVRNGGGAEAKQIQQAAKQPAQPMTLWQRLQRSIRHRWRKYVLSDEAKEVQFRTQGEVHRWMYDAYSLQRLLIERGFRTVQRMDYDTSQIPHWTRYGLDVDDHGAQYKTLSLYMEGVK